MQAEALRTGARGRRDFFLPGHSLRRRGYLHRGRFLSRRILLFHHVESSKNVPLEFVVFVQTLEAEPGLEACF